MKTIEVVSFVLLSALLGCSSTTSPGKPFTACTIGSLTGTWRVTYVETDGNCGKVADETVVLSSAATPGAPGTPACTIAANQVSPDHCRIDLDFTCTLNGAPGTQRWIGATRQVSATELSSSLTLTVTSPSLGSCRSTYAVDWTQQ